MIIKNPEKRLNQFWGLVDKKHTELIIEYLNGKNILDLGCGYGTTTKYIKNLGYNCIGVDNDPSAIEYCKKTKPDCIFQVANAEYLPFENNYFDTLILRDSLHHFYGDTDFNKVKKEISRVLKKGGRIIFFDPNVNFVLKTMRKISFHNDKECTFEEASKIMEDMGYHIIHHQFNTVYSLPLSGGYVGLNLTPNIKFIHNFILKSEIYVERILNKIHLGRQLCWRYIIVGEK